MIYSSSDLRILSLCSCHFTPLTKVVQRYVFIFVCEEAGGLILRAHFHGSLAKAHFRAVRVPIVAKTFFSLSEPSYFFGGKVVAAATTAAAGGVVLDNFRKGRDRRRKRLKWPPLLRGFMLSGSSRRYYPAASVLQSRCA